MYSQRESASRILEMKTGGLATVAMLHGRDAEAFLAGQGVASWCRR